jgi:PAS domain S-box-containing protein
MVGRDPAQLASMRLHEITHPEDMERNRALFAPLAAGHGEPFTIEKRYLRPDGGEVWVTNSVSLVRGPQGEPRHLVAVSLDITDRKHAEATLTRRNERLRMLWEAAAVILTTSAPDAMLRALFERIRGSLGLDAYANYMVAEAPGTLRLASYAGIDEAEARAIERLEFGQAICGTVALRRQPLAMSHIQSSNEPIAGLVRGWGIRAYACAPLLAGDRLLGTLSFASRSKEAFEPDELEFLETITQYVTVAYERLRLIEEMREQDRRKDEFLATLSHELRNPLAPIRNGLHLFRLAAGNPSIVETARSMMERQVDHMVRLVDDLLDMSRISRNKLELRREWVELGTVLRTAVETSRPMIDAAGHALELQLPEAPVLLDADPVRLAQVFSNLVNNAAKYTPRGGRIRVAAHGGADEVRVTVSDNGIGIAPAELARIFDMFVQLERTPESAHGGLGIGLTLVKRLVEMHDGEVTARSAGPGQGSEFEVRLPIVVPDRAGASAERPEDSRAQPRRRIVVADDNRDAADSLAMMLQCLGHEVFVAHDGEAAVELATSVEPDIAFLDLGMPRMTGHEAARRICEQSNARRPMLVAITGWGQEEDRRRSSAAGFDRHLVKPVDLAMLQAVIEEAPAAAVPARHPA